MASVVGGVLLIISDFLELLLVGYNLGEAATTRTLVIVTGLTLLGTVLLVGLVRLYWRPSYRRAFRASKLKRRGV